MSNPNNVNEDPHFPGDGSVATGVVNKGPGASAENPGGVHPTTDAKSGSYMPERTEGQQGPSIFHAIENPYALKEALNKLEASLDEVIDLFKGEGSTLSKDGDFAQGKAG